MTVRAKTLVKDKFWIVEENGTKLGTLQKQNDNGWIFLSKTENRDNTSTQSSRKQQAQTKQKQTQNQKQAAKGSREKKSKTKTKQEKRAGAEGWEEALRRKSCKTLRVRVCNVLCARAQKI